MTYTSYINILKSKSEQISKLKNNISKIDLENIWEGAASNKQKDELSNIQIEIESQLTQLSSINEAMKKIDDYDIKEEEIKSYKNQLNSLESNDKSYLKKKEEIQEKINNLIEEKEKLKTDIENKLFSINKSYQSQIIQIKNTEIVKTFNLLKDAENNFKELNFNIIASKNSNKEKSSNSGTITIENIGTPYEKEPTPGKSAQKLHVYHDNTRLYDDAYITIKKGETIRLNMNLTENCGEVKLLKRTSADGEENWKQYLSAHSEPFVNRDDSSTFIATNNYDWVITGNKATNGYITLSQTSSHSTNNGNNYKSMYRIHVKVVE